MTADVACEYEYNIYLPGLLEGSRLASNRKTLIISDLLILRNPTVRDPRAYLGLVLQTRREG